MGGLLAARACGVPTGGMAPKGWRTEEGPKPDLASFGLIESSSESYTPRTYWNATNADATVIFGNVASAGSRLTAKTCRTARKPVWVNPTADELIALIRQHKVSVLNVAGNRESVTPGIQTRVETLMTEVLRGL